VQALKPPPSSWQKKLAPDSLEKPRLALAELLGSVGWESTEGGAGAVVSIDHEKEAALLSLPAASRALTWKLCAPSASPE